MGNINGKKVLQVVRTVEAGGGTLLTTTTDATLVSGTTYELALTYLTDTPNVDDYVAYINSGSISTLYQVSAVDSTNATLTKIGEFGGKKLYQHNVSIKLYDNNMLQTDFVISFRIINADSEAFNYTKFKTLILDTLGENSQRTIDNGFFAVNGFYQNNANYKIEGIVTGNNAFAWTDDTMWIAYSNSNNITYTNIPLENNTRYTFTFKDNPKLL